MMTSNNRLLAKIDVIKFKKILKDNGTNMTKLEKELEKPIRKYVRYGEMPWSVISSIVLYLDDFDHYDMDSFIDHKEELYRDTSERIRDLERMIYVLRNENKLLTRDNERLSSILHSLEKSNAEENERLSNVISQYEKEAQKSEQMD